MSISCRWSRFAIQIYEANGLGLQYEDITYIFRCTESLKKVLKTGLKKVTELKKVLKKVMKLKKGLKKVNSLKKHSKK